MTVSQSIFYHVKLLRLCNCSSFPVVRNEIRRNYVNRHPRAILALLDRQQLTVSSHIFEEISLFVARPVLVLNDRFVIFLANVTIPVLFPANTDAIITLTVKVFFIFSSIISSSLAISALSFLYERDSVTGILIHFIVGGNKLKSRYNTID